MNISGLRQILKSCWAFLWRGWSMRGDIGQLCDLYETMPKQEGELREQIVALGKEVAEANRVRELAEKGSEILTRELAQSQADLKELHGKYADLLKRKEAPEERMVRDALYLAIARLLARSSPIFSTTIRSTLLAQKLPRFERAQALAERTVIERIGKACLSVRQLLHDLAN